MQIYLSRFHARQGARIGRAIIFSASSSSRWFLLRIPPNGLSRTDTKLRELADDVGPEGALDRVHHGAAGANGADPGLMVPRPAKSAGSLSAGWREPTLERSRIRQVRNVSSAARVTVPIRRILICQCKEYAKVHRLSSAKKTDPPLRQETSWRPEPPFGKLAACLKSIAQSSHNHW